MSSINFARGRAGYISIKAGLKGKERRKERKKENYIYDVISYIARARARVHSKLGYLEGALVENFFFGAKLTA